MARAWEADVELSLGTATQLIEDQFTALAPARLEYGTEIRDTALCAAGEYALRSAGAD